jgi:hypothetical protein
MSEEENPKETDQPPAVVAPAAKQGPSLKYIIAGLFVLAIAIYLGAQQQLETDKSELLESKKSSKAPSSKAVGPNVPDIPTEGRRYVDMTKDRCDWGFARRL